MTGLDAAGLVVTLALAAYLLYALIRADRLG